MTLPSTSLRLPTREIRLSPLRESLCPCGAWLHISTTLGPTSSLRRLDPRPCRFRTPACSPQMLITRGNTQASTCCTRLSSASCTAANSFGAGVRMREMDLVLTTTVYSSRSNTPSTPEFSVTSKKEARHESKKEVFKCNVVVGLSADTNRYLSGGRRSTEISKSCRSQT